jgi:hypothetical protein
VCDRYGHPVRRRKLAPNDPETPKEFRSQSQEK